MRRLPYLPLAILALSGLLVLPARAQHATATDKPWPRVGFQEVIDTTKFLPSMGKTRGESGNCIIFLANAGDGSNRLFVVERSGNITILQDGKLQSDPFLNISNLTSMDGERGLLSMAFPPDYKTKGQFYVCYTAAASAGHPRGNVTLARYKVDPKDPNHALADSAEILLTVPHTKNSNHNGGQLAFGPKDGYLYMSAGDGGSQYDPSNNAQNLNALLGKILRIDVASTPDTGKAYHVPADNPFVKTPNALPEIWSIGLRNPWRFSFDPVNGDLYIGNVGQDKWEQIYFQPGTSKGGENYGWSILEGTHDTLDRKKIQPSGTTTPFVLPVAEYSHNPDKFLSITGGYVYRGTEFPDWKGVYFFSDWNNSQFWALRRGDDGQWHNKQVDDNKSPVGHPPTFGVDEKGNIYTAGFSDGKIYKLVELPAEN
jgi:glucose/arabinose dehydrogenase